MKYFILFVTAPTGIPANIKVSERNDTFLSLTWDDIPCGSRGGIIRHYKYHMKSLEESHCTFTGTTPERVFSRNDLNCTSPLAFQVAGVNEAGEGPYSEFIKIPNTGSKLRPAVLVYVILVTLYQVIK